MAIIGSSSGQTVRGPTVADADFSLAVQQRDTLLAAGTITERTEDDSVYEDEVSDTVDRVEDVIATDLVPGTFDHAPTFTSLNTAVATVDSSGMVTRVSDGIAPIIVKTRLVRKRINVTVSRLGATVITFQDFVSGSLAWHCADAVDTRIAGKTFATAAPLYSTQNHSAGIYVRNPSFWAADLNLTCISPWNQAGANQLAGTLVSPRHVVIAEHFPFGTGIAIRFVKSDNTVVTRTVTNIINVGPPNTGPGGDSYATDIRVGLLDSDVPAGISFAKVFPAGFDSYLPGIINGVPALYLDQEEKGLLADLHELTASRASLRPARESSERRSFYEPLVAGDSGNPVFLIVNNELVLLTTWTFGFGFVGGGGPNYAENINLINTAMTTLGGGYTLTTASLAGFTAY